jgi:uncharacterized protein
MKWILVLLFPLFSFADVALISVTGVVEKSMEPNMIHLDLEIWGKAAAAKDAQTLQATGQKLVQAVIERYQIKKGDVQSTGYSLSPEYIYDQKTQSNKMTGFRASQNLHVILRKIADGGTFIDAVATSKSQASGVSVQNIQWDSDKKNQIETQALGEAVVDARLKAEELAKAALVKIKRVYRLSHVSRLASPVGFEMLRGNSKNFSADQHAPTELSAGQIKVIVTVNADFEI